MKGIHVVDPLFSDKTFSDIKHYVLHTARHSGEFEELFHRTKVRDSKVLDEVHDYLSEFASDLFKERLKPTFSYISNYLAGGRCMLHADRVMCYKSVNVLVNEDVTDEGWPIRIAEPWTDEQWKNSRYELYNAVPGDVSPSELEGVKWHDIVLKPNSAVCYSGSHSWHYRPTLSKGRVDLLFFFFAQEDYAGPLY